jgi:hypothetical protein
MPLLSAPEIYIRFLFVVPLLALAEVIVATSIAVQVRYFSTSGLVPEQEQPRFKAVKASAARLRNSVPAEVILLALSVTIPVGMRVIAGFDARESSWERLDGVITAAGGWYDLVSLPILFFFLLRWCWVFLLWTWFLWGVSRLNLELTPTHPDRAGGLGFVVWGLASFATVQMAVSAIVSSALAHEIVHPSSYRSWQRCCP